MKITHEMMVVAAVATKHRIHPDDMRKLLEAAFSSACYDASKIRAAALEEAARLIEDHQITSTSSGPSLTPRSDGNRDGLAYAAAIRTLKYRT